MKSQHTEQKNVTGALGDTSCAVCLRLLSLASADANLGRGLFNNAFGRERPFLHRCPVG